MFQWKSLLFVSLAVASVWAAPVSQSDVLSARQDKPFTLQNGKDAQALNAKFSGLTADSPCNAGENACIGGQFAQCVAGKFVATGCAPPTQCFALPLVNSPGTSITCTTPADAQTRIANTGAGGVTG